MLGIDFQSGPTVTPTATRAFYGSTESDSHLIRIGGTGLSYDANGWIDGGTITSIQLYDYSGLPPFLVLSVSLRGGGVPGADFAGFLTPLVATFAELDTWPAFDPSDSTFVSATPTEMIFENESGTFTRIEGSGFVAGTFAVGTVTAIQHLLALGGPVLDEVTGLSMSARQAELLIGGSFALYDHLAGGNSVIVELPGATGLFEPGIYFLSGGLGNDYIEGAFGETETVTYYDATSAVAVNLESGLAIGGGGNDTLVFIYNVAGSAFNDTIRGCPCDNVLLGHFGDDVLLGIGGNDLLLGEAGNDTIFGGEGDDILVGGEGDDILNGGLGNDAVSFADAAGPITVDLRITAAQNTGEGMDELRSISDVEGSENDDTIIGSGAANVLDGSDGLDTIRGLAGDDSIYGRDGLDRLSGGLGTDYFVFNFESGFGYSFVEGRDRILDFEIGTDKIVLTEEFFYGGFGSTLSANNFFLVGSGAQDADDYLIYDQAGGRLYFDVNASDPGGRALLAVLDAGQALTADDIVVDLFI